MTFVRRTRSAAVLLAALVVLTSATPQMAMAKDNTQAGLWVGCAFIDLLYTPMKATFFLLMGISGGLSAMVTVPLDRVDISAQMIKWGFYGDWLVRPDHFSDGYMPQFVGFDEEIRFIQYPGPWAPVPATEIARAGGDTGADSIRRQ